MTKTLTDTTVEVVATLPDNATELFISQLEEVGELKLRIAGAQMDAASSMQEMVEVVCREHPGVDDRPMRELCTADQAAELEHLGRRLLDAERAWDVLSRWCDRTGFGAVMGAMADDLGVDRPPEPQRETEPSMGEDLDGQLWVTVPSRGEEG